MSGRTRPDEKAMILMWAASGDGGVQGRIVERVRLASLGLIF